MSTKRVWENGDPEPYPWPTLRDREGRSWVSCQAGWHLEGPKASNDNCVGWVTLLKRHGPLTEAAVTSDR